MNMTPNAKTLLAIIAAAGSNGIDAEFTKPVDFFSANGNYLYTGCKIIIGGRYFAMPVYHELVAARAVRSENISGWTSTVWAV